jgi:hypothetical protein
MLKGERTLPLLLAVGIMSLPFSRRKIDGYKVPSKYTTDFLQVLADFKPLNIPVLVWYVGPCLGIKTGTGGKDPTPLV